MCQSIFQSVTIQCFNCRFKLLAQILTEICRKMREIAVSMVFQRVFTSFLSEFFYFNTLNISFNPNCVMSSSIQFSVWCNLLSQPSKWIGQLAVLPIRQIVNCWIIFISWDQFAIGCLCVCVHGFSPQFALSFDLHAVSLVCVSGLGILYSHRRQ